MNGRNPMRTTLLVTLAAGGLLINVLLTIVLAHHAFNSEFDAAKPIKLTGVVKKREWINPHSWLTIDVKRTDDAIETWVIEDSARNAMLRHGSNMNRLPSGTGVVVHGYQANE